VRSSGWRSTPTQQGKGSRGGSVNTAFRAAARAIVIRYSTEGDDTTTLLTHVLRQAALRWLTDLGVRPEQAEVLVSSEPQLGDRWLAYLALAPVSVIEDLIRGDGH
jgi:hypothetical protein